MRLDQSTLETSLTIRERRAEDDATYARLLSKVMTAAYDEAALRDRRERYSHKMSIERVATLDGQMVGFGELFESGAGANCRIVVDEPFRGRGIGSSLMDSLRHHSLFERPKVFGQVPDNDKNAISFVERAGFKLQAHVFESFIDPSEFNLQPFQPAIERLQSDGLRIATLAELGMSPENRYRLWEIEHVTDLDIPGLDPDQLPSWEDAKRSWYQASWFNPAAEFIALDGDRFVGLSGVAEMAPGTWSILHTCTLREYRGRGIATALKALATNFAKQKGSRLLKTNNHSGNAPMLSINRRFGFKPLPGWLEYTKFAGGQQ